MPIWQNDVASVQAAASAAAAADAVAAADGRMDD